MADGNHEEFAEDCYFPIRHLSSTSDPSSPAYSFEHINTISDQLGIPWELSKDTNFSAYPVFLGFEWDLVRKTVKLTEAKSLKYASAIRVWLQTETHTLSEVEKLHGKLIHASLVIPEGSAYITSLQSMLGLFSDRPFMPRTQPRGTIPELNWWLNALDTPCPIPIPHFPRASDHNAFSDASSSFGIAITIGSKWRAWRLKPGWDKDNHDIGWAESIGFEFLVTTLLILDSTSLPLSVYGDNQGVVDPWRKGQSKNKPTNATFHRVFACLCSPPQACLCTIRAKRTKPSRWPLLRLLSHHPR